MWHLDEELEVWFEEVEQQRKSKYSSDDDDGPQGGPFMQNELAIGRK